jgi:hypothetical protein
MVCLLKPIQVFNVWWQNVASPLKIALKVLLSVYHDESRVFAAIDHRVVNVSVVRNFE